MLFRSKCNYLVIINNYVALSVTGAFKNVLSQISVIFLVLVLPLALLFGVASNFPTDFCRIFHAWCVLDVCLTCTAPHCIWLKRGTASDHFLTLPVGSRDQVMESRTDLLKVWSCQFICQDLLSCISKFNM